jgi:oxygen-independent coproporphyrinogen-3 oxidase
MAGIYLHIPFCKQACNYCNFHFSTSLKLKDEVLKAIMHELEMQRHYLNGAPVETIYFGGGTPSLLSSGEIQRLCEHIFTHFPVDNLKECTLEANPDDLTTKYLKELRGTPISRFSIGTQSFLDSDLVYMNRAHSAPQADYAIKAAQDAGFSNITIDLIYGTPGLSNTGWKFNLAKIEELQIPHFSAYALTVEDDTVLHRRIAKKLTPPVETEQAAVQFEILMEQAEKMGYEHYEISNLARPGHYAVHNTNYWSGQPYLGIGPSAHSFDGRARRRNIANNALYAKSILLESQLCYEEEILSPTDRLNEYIMTSLRTMWGCDMGKIRNEWGEDMAGKLLKEGYEFIERGWLIEEHGKLVLTNAGKLFADGIASELFIDAAELL